MSVKFHDHEVKSKLADRRKLSAYLLRLVHSHLKVAKVALSYIFCSDEYLLGLNMQFLQHDTFTDIVTFDMSENDNELVGEIYVSVDRVAENASKFGTTYKDELHRVIFHGALHLCGFKDKTDADQELMRKKENECLSAYEKERA